MTVGFDIRVSSFLLSTGVIDIAAILGIGRTVCVGQLRNIVVIIIHVAAAAEGLVCPLAAVIVRVFVRVEGYIPRGVEKGAQQPAQAVVIVGDVGRVGQVEPGDLFRGGTVAAGQRDVAVLIGRRACRRDDV